MQGGAYGASFAGGAFDIQSFIRQPQTILRCLSWVSHAEALASKKKKNPKKLASCHITEFVLTDVKRYARNNRVTQLAG